MFPECSLQVEVVDPSGLTITQLVAKLARARVVMGVHGGQMSNIMFAQPDKNTAVIEIVGRQVSTICRRRRAKCPTSCSRSQTRIPPSLRLWAAR
jgi:capsular polysaccharide biosynthesis protein